jgi:hypothetical protein
MHHVLTTNVLLTETETKISAEAPHATNRMLFVAGIGRWDRKSVIAF